jgi:cytochrome bd-type quinol oxidase subunit 2
MTQPDAFERDEIMETILACFAALLVGAMHAALLTTLAASGELQSRARRIAPWLYWIVCITLLGITLQGGMKMLLPQTSEPSLVWLFPLTATAGLFGLRLFLSVGLDLWAFLSSTVSIAGLLGCVAVELYPRGAGLLGI